MAANPALAWFLGWLRFGDELADELRYRQFYSTRGERGRRGVPGEESPYTTFVCRVVSVLVAAGEPVKAYQPPRKLREPRNGSGCTAELLEQLIEAAGGKPPADLKRLLITARVRLNTAQPRNNTRRILSPF